MLKFFRRIRKDLLSKNDGAKYFKYAMGEIILVVLGILIALQINNWNEGQKSKVAEKAFLSNLLEEARTNQEDSKVRLEYHKFVKEKTKELAQVISPNPPDISRDKLDTLMFAMMFQPQFKGITTSMNSAKLDLVEDYELKKVIAQWNLKYEEYRYDLQLTYDHIQNHALRFISENYQLKNIKSHFPIVENDKSDFPVNVKFILSNSVFENYAKLRSLNAQHIFKEAAELIEIQESLIEYLEEKLNENN